MGQIIRAHCEQCGFQQDLFAGGGRMDCELNTILSSLDEICRPVMEDYIRQGATSLDITRRPWLCTSCGSLHALPVVSFTLNEARMELWSLCPRCSGAEGTALAQGQTLPCPHCGNELLPQQIGHWD